MKEIAFGEFRLDLANECLWRGSTRISLRPKAFAVLKLLAEHPNQLVNKQQVLDAVWPETFVGDAVLKDNIRQIREALGDNPDAPSYIETAHRRGYRFIGSAAKPRLSDERAAKNEHMHHRLLPDDTASPMIPVLGRESELATLQMLFGKVLSWKRQAVFIAGEPGIGKTTLVQSFLEQTVKATDVAIARGQCLEQYGSGEAYLPVLDGMLRLCRTSIGDRVLGVLRQHAPTWLAQMPSLLSQTESQKLHAQATGVTRERMLREIADAIEALTAEYPLLLVLEDIHWSDYSTLDLISYLARRHDPARLMIISTYRPVDVILSDHPLKSVKRELQAHSLCLEIALEYLSEETVGLYLAARFPKHELPNQLSNAVYQRTEGNPLFMVNMVEYLCDQKMIFEQDGRWRLGVGISDVEKSVPTSIRQLIERQIDRLTEEEREVLDGASVGGMEFSILAIAAGIGKPVQWVEERCEGLSRRHQFLSAAWMMELPDGTVTPRHRFVHVLHRDVPYQLLPPLRRSQIHHRIAESEVATYGERNNEIATELAMHFEQSRDWENALQHIIQAARNASWKSAHYEAAELARRGLGLQKFLPSSSERDQQEIALRAILSASLMALNGFASPEVEQVYTDAGQLFEQSAPSAQLFNVLYLHGISLMVGGKVKSALGVAERLMVLGEGLKDPALQMEARRLMGSTLQKMGRCEEALDHLERASRLYQENLNQLYPMAIGHDFKAPSESCASSALWALGFPDAALRRMQDGLAHARQHSHAQSLVAANHYAAQLHQFRGETGLAQQRAEELIDVAGQFGFKPWLAFGNIYLGCAEAKLGRAQQGIDRMNEGITAYSGMGGKLWLPYFLGLLAEALGTAGRADDGIGLVEEAIKTAEINEELFVIAELYRIKGELLVEMKVETDQLQAEAERCFAKSLKIARAQHLRSWELRTLMSIRGHGLNEGVPESDLAACYSTFNEGFETEDLRRAKESLAGKLRV